MISADGAKPVETRVGSARWQTVELLRGETVRLPVCRQLSEVTVERSILLQHEHNMVDRFHAGLRCGASSIIATAAGGGLESLAPENKQREAQQRHHWPSFE